MIRTFTCIICPNGCDIETESDGGAITAITGAACQRGKEYVQQEITNPQRNIATLAKVENGTLPVVSVRLSKSVPKAAVLDIVAEIRKLKLVAPVAMGQIVLPKVLGFDSNVIATANVEAKSRQ